MSVTIHEVLADLRVLATSESQKGTLSEDLIAKYLRTDPQYAAQFAKVWRWMEWPGDKDKSTIIYNSHITLKGIPEDAYRYMLGSRSAIEWIMDRYQVKTDKASGIVNDPNDWADEQDDPRYIIDLVKRIVTVSLETMAIVDGLPALDIIE